MSRFDDIAAWADARNIILGASPEKQFVKLMEEIGELAEGIAKGRRDAIFDGIGDAVVVLTILAKQFDTDIEHCIELAWNEIKDRKGRIVNGVFMKESDL